MSSVVMAEDQSLLQGADPAAGLPYLAAVLEPHQGKLNVYPKQFDPPFEERTIPDASQNPFVDYPSLEDFYVPYDEPGYVDRSVEYLVESREKLSDALENMGRRMDAYFAGEKFQTYNNDSYAILRLGGKWYEGAEFDPDFNVKFRLDMPGTKERYRLVLQYGDDNDRSLEERNRPSEAASTSDQNSLFAGLLRTLDGGTGEWETKLSAGVKVKAPPDPFVRSTGLRQFKLSPDWNLQLRGQAEWFNSDGFHGDVDIILDNLVAENFLFRSNTLLDWREELDTLEFGQVFSLYQQLPGTRAIEYQLGAFGTGYDYSEVDIVYLSAAYRSQPYKDWLYLSVIPEVAFPREENFHQTFSITVLLEVHFR
ncbi:hypothetical protein FT643_05865 [Ketobacter sp. MCCC 1A13808]|uniref:hypothetical protein n=1 Tax=Ketobacter sp. MCCC 1A13808 TaxID=2602738 RepID=UPI0012EC60E4|nr:hypothetical protein [Ketobacter sp. MCCC 1A13808]MVF11667.1 hypothetical protein [Ketobacter sp. MCCC 1A13808]